MSNSVNFVARKLNISESQVNVVLTMLQEGATVPFIARYRQGQTNGLDERVIEQINDLYQYDVELNKRKLAIIEILNEAKVLTPQIENAINAANTKAELESIYEPFKAGKKTKATEAIEKGLEPLAKTIFTTLDNNFNPIIEAKKFVNEKVKNVDEAIEGAKLIIAQWISIDVETRNYVKNQIYEYGTIVSKAKKKASELDVKKTFQNYYESSEKVSKIPNHRFLAMMRGEDMDILSIKFEFNEKKILFDLNNKYFKIKTTGNIIMESLVDSLDRLIYPSVQREIKSSIFERAEKEAIKLFGDNLEQMLLAPAIKNKTVLAIDPGYISGCKVAVVSPTSEVLKIDLIEPTPPRRDIIGSSRTIIKLVNEFRVDIIVIGNGTASREVEQFVATLIKDNNLNIKFAIVSEVGASVYSASKIAVEEFPDLSVEQRSAITIARRFQDPLNELVKVDPKAIGVGQYQHDVDQNELSKTLDSKVKSVVNKVGVDINTATKEILCHISGLSKSIAKNIVDYRKENGVFSSRKELKDVKGLGPKAFEQSIGFIRIHDSKEFLDKTQIHPESYKLAYSIIDELKINLKNIDKNILQNADVKKLAEKFNSNIFDVKLIIDSLIEPGKDIRDSQDGPILKSDVLEMKDLKQGLQLEGTVQNITDFGAFVYIGLKEAALIHISNMSTKYVSHPSQIVKTGQKVLIEIMSVDMERKRIQAKLIS